MACCGRRLPPTMPLAWSSWWLSTEHGRRPCSSVLRCVCGPVGGMKQHRIGAMSMMISDVT